MAKRLTDSGKWDDPWFTELQNEYKLLWIYMLDKCDHAGFWKVNKPLTEFILKFKFDWEDVQTKFQHRLVTITPELWHLPKFIEFQYGKLSPNNRAHISVMERLSKYETQAIKPHASPLQGDKDMDKEKDKEKDKEVIDPKFNQLEAFNEIWELYPAKGRLKRSESLRVWCEIVVRRDTASRIQTALGNYTAHLNANSDWGKKPKELSNWLKEWSDWENHVEEKPLEDWQLEALKERGLNA